MASLLPRLGPVKRIEPLTVATAQSQLLPLVRLHRDNIRLSFKEMQSIGFINKNNILTDEWITALENEVNYAIRSEGLCAEVAIGKALVDCSFLYQGERWLVWYKSNRSPKLSSCLWPQRQLHSPTHRSIADGTSRGIPAAAFNQFKGSANQPAPWPTPSESISGSTPKSSSTEASVEGTQLPQSQAEAQPRKPPATKKRRLNPESSSTAPNGTRGYAGTRFCWNVGFFFQSLVQHEPIKTDYRTFEALANNLFLIPPEPTQHGLHPNEHAAVRDSNLAIAEYRSIRARILIGLALVYEHNLRGMRLHQQARTHPACRPDPHRCFKIINLGKTRAQEVCYGSDVSRASLVFVACQQVGYIPAGDALKRNLIRDRGSLEEVERCWPRNVRKRLYKRLVGWYDGLNLRAEVRFVIEDDDAGGDGGEEGGKEDKAEGDVEDAHEEDVEEGQSDNDNENRGCDEVELEEDERDGQEGNNGARDPTVFKNVEETRWDLQPPSNRC